MKNKAVTFFSILGLLLSLCSCFPTAEKNASISKTDKITFEQLALQEAHITQKPFNKFIVDADVQICVKSAFNTYNVKACNYNIETLKNIFLKNNEIIQNVDIDGFASAKSTDGSLVTNAVSNGTSCITFYTQELKDRELPYFFANVNNSGAIIQNRDELFQKELDFMSSDNAVSIVREKAEQLNIPVSRYLVYSIDYEFIQSRDKKELAEFGTDGYVEHTKEDEFYLIVMRAALPNGSEFAELQYHTIDVANQYVTSTQVYAVVNRNGLALFEGRSLYTSYEENETASKIVSAEQALSIIKKKYEAVQLQEDINIYNIELSYLPYLTADNETFILKPTWVFHGTKTNDIGTLHCKWAVDAVTGAEVKM